MKINARILSIIFFIVLLLSVSSALVYYSITTKILKDHQVQLLKNSKRDLVFSLNNLHEYAEDEFNILKDDYLQNKKIDQLNTIDFFLVADKQNISYLKIKDSTKFKSKYITTENFFEENSDVILNYDYSGDIVFFFGYFIKENLLENISNKINAEVAIIKDYELVLTSHENNFNEKLDFSANSENKIAKQPIFESIYGEQDLMYSFLDESSSWLADKNSSFVVFNLSSERKQYSEVMKYFIAIMLIAGITLSIILVLIFTARMRKQLSLLTTSIEKTSLGDFSHRVEVLSKTEDGKLAAVFNNMLDKIEKQTKKEKEYFDLVALLNIKASMTEVSKEVLNKIVSTIKVSCGAIYEIDDHKIQLKASSGLDVEIGKIETNNIYKDAINEQKWQTHNYERNHPIVKIGQTELKVKSHIIIPVIYNIETIALIELISENYIEEEALEYLKLIQDQLAIGFANAISYEKLENLVTELKRLNEDYQSRNEEINRQNRELKNLHEELKKNAEKLKEEQERALMLSDAKSKFLANMSHELKTPLNSMLGLSDLLLKSEDLEYGHQEKIEVILRNGQRLTHLINNILEYSKIESDKVTLNTEEFSLRKSFDDIIPVIKPLANNKSLKFSEKIESYSDLIIKSDKLKFEQIVINLLSNSIKYTNEGSVDLRAYVENKDLVISVKDTGIGISEKDKEKIFEEFSKLDKDDANKYDGVGLGLAISKKYSELLDGSITFRTDEKGTEFILKLHEAVEKKVGDKLSNFEETKNKVLIYEKKSNLKILFDNYLSSDDIKFIFNDTTKLKFNDSIKYIIINLYEMKEDEIREILNKKDSDTPLIFVWVSDEYSMFLNVCNFIDQSILSGYLGNKEYEYLAIKADKIEFESKYGETKVLEELKAKEKLKSESDKVFVIKSDESLSSIEKSNSLTKGLDFNLNRVLFSYSNINEVLKSFKEFSLKQKNLPQDVLRFIKKRLNIKFTEKITNNLIQSDGSEQIENIKKENLQVLIVDDDADALFMVGEIIKEMGIKTKFASNGLECLTILEHFIPDLILLDIRMPVMDGFETIKNLRSNIKTQYIPVVALTAHAMLEEKDIIIKNGFNDLITKPINTDMIKNKVSELISL